MLMLLLASCGQSYNSNSGDIAAYEPIEGIDASTPDGARLLVAYKAFQPKCFSCHSGYADYKTSEQWVNAGLVTPGMPSTSTVYTILKNAGGRMPPDPVAQLTTEEFEAVEAWISGM